MLEGRRIEHAWGGPIDVSPTHLPAIVTLQGGRAWAAFGYTGNGVGPGAPGRRARSPRSRSGAREDAARWAWIDPPPKVVPPEPLRVAGARLIRAALVRKEAAEEAGRPRRPGHARPRGGAVAARTAHRALICR